jgi:hypothetical protein
VAFTPEEAYNVADSIKQRTGDGCVIKAQVRALIPAIFETIINLIQDMQFLSEHRSVPSL